MAGRSEDREGRGRGTEGRPVGVGDSVEGLRGSSPSCKMPLGCPSLRFLMEDVLKVS